MRRIGRALIPMICAAALFATAPSAAAQDRLEIFDQAVGIVASQFYDPEMNGLDWQAVAAEHRARISADMDDAAFAAEVNAMLGRLDASHTVLVMRDDPAWSQLVGVFMAFDDSAAGRMAAYLDNGAPRYAGIGLFTEERAEGRFVTGVLHGHPAERAGLLVGDRILSVEGAPFHPFRSFEGKARQTLTLSVERRPGETLELQVTPTMLNGATMFQTAMRQSVSLTERDGARVGYVRLWSWAGDAYQEILRYLLLGGSLSKADALVLDLRGGWGGAQPRYLNLFSKQGFEVAARRRNGRSYDLASSWSKPVVLLVDESARSGKELIAHAFKTLGVGPVVGERTSGAVLGAWIHVLRDGSLLYVAMQDISVDGVRLEGVGVAPDVEVPFDPAYAAGADPQRDRAVEIAAGLARE